MRTLATVTVLGYLLGSLPTAVLIGRRLGRVDVRRAGSGNPGASNVLRLLGWGPAILVLVIDVAKGCLAVLLASWLLSGSPGPQQRTAMMAAGAAAIVGHVWPLFAGLRGGKGVATTAGVMALLFPVPLTVSLALFVVVVVATRRISAASLVAALALPLALALLGSPSRAELAFVTAIALFVVTLHGGNIRRLLSGQEPSLVGEKRSDSNLR